MLPRPRRHSRKREGPREGAAVMVKVALTWHYRLSSCPGPSPKCPPAPDLMARKCGSSMQATEKVHPSHAFPPSYPAD